MKSGPFVLAFVATCAMLGAIGLSLHRTPSLPASDYGPARPPTTWPDFSPTGPGFKPPLGPDGPIISYGHELITRTFAVIGPEVPDAAMRFAGNNLSCQNCHLNAGTSRFGLPLVGIVRSYPRRLPDGREMNLVDRLNQCMLHSMNGRALPPGSREMAAMIAYLRYIGDPEPVRELPPAPVPALAASAERGATVFATVCAACHQADGQGKRNGAPGDAGGYIFPPLWGPDSFNEAAGFDFSDRIVPFVMRNMPTGVDPLHPLLTPQQAWDVAAYVLAQPRPRFGQR